MIMARKMKSALTQIRQRQQYFINDAGEIGKSNFFISLFIEYNI